MQVFKQHRFIAVMNADGSGVSEIIENGPNNVTTTGRAVMIHSASEDDLKEAVYSFYPPGLEDNELPPQARALSAIENHGLVTAGNVVVEKA
jgi:hypothetical protein